MAGPTRLHMTKCREMETRMKSLANVCRDSLLPAAVAGVAVLGTLALAGRRDSRSAIAPINASSHVIWGDDAAQIEQPTLRHTVPGVAINLGAVFWWAFIFRFLFGRVADRGPLPALAAGASTMTLAWLLDYKVLPRRLTPGWELRISDRSLFAALAVMGAGLGLGAILSTARERH